MDRHRARCVNEANEARLQPRWPSRHAWAVLPTRNRARGATIRHIAGVILDSAARRPDKSVLRAHQTPSKLSTVQAHASRAMRANFLLLLRLQSLARSASKGIQEEVV